MNRSPLSLLYWLLLLYTRGVWCLRMVSLSVPDRVSVGDTVKLSCRFDLEGDPLYSVKWYRDDVEFFRFVPKDRPPAQYFPMEGVDVDLRHSANATVLLRAVDRTTSGRFKCEVSADAPSFQTEAVHTRLDVRDPDDRDSGSPVHPLSLLLLSCLSLLL